MEQRKVTAPDRKFYIVSGSLRQAGVAALNMGFHPTPQVPNAHGERWFYVRDRHVLYGITLNDKHDDAWIFITDSAETHPDYQHIALEVRHISSIGHARLASYHDTARLGTGTFMGAPMSYIPDVLAAYRAVSEPRQSPTQPTDYSPVPVGFPLPASQPRPLTRTAGNEDPR